MRTQLDTTPDAKRRSHESKLDERRCFVAHREPLKLLQGHLRGLLAEAGEKKLDADRHVGTLGHPVLDSSDIQAQFDFRAARNRIEKPHALEAGAALALAAVGPHNVIKRGLLAAASSQTNRHHLESTLQSVAANCNDNLGSRATTH